MEGEEYGSEARKFVERHFYVDNGLKSFPSEGEAISVLKATQDMLIKLHKITSNNTGVMKAFQAANLAKDLQDLYVGQDILSVQRSLGFG